MIATGLHTLDITVGVRFVAIALTTTAIGTLLPILGDAGVFPTRLGANILASGSVGEIEPIIAISLALTTDDPGRTTAILIVFMVIAGVVGWLATRPAKPRTIELITRTLHSSGQLGVRICVMLCLILVWTASESGSTCCSVPSRRGWSPVCSSSVIPRTGRPRRRRASNRQVQHRLEALSFGFFIPLFFVVSGVRFDLDALLDPVEWSRCRCSCACSSWCAASRRCSIGAIWCRATWWRSACSRLRRCPCSWSSRRSASRTGRCAPTTQPGSWVPACCRS